MTTTVDSGASRQLCRRASTTAAIVVAVLALGTATATTAVAKPKPKPGLNEFLSCVQSHADAINPDNTKISHEALIAIAQNCCTNLGGIYNESHDDCYLPNGDVGKPQPLPTGATAALPPGDLNPTDKQ